jgi:hypothetical protein
MNDITHDKRARISRIHKNERVIIIAPVGQDADAIATLLDSQGFETQICDGIPILLCAIRTARSTLCDTTR